MIRTWKGLFIYLLLFLGGSTLLFLGGNTFAVDKIRVLLVDGQNNHNWVETSQSLRGTLERAGLFEVVTETSPPAKASESIWENWQPDFKGFDVVVSNYNGRLWPESMQKAFVDYVRSGGGVAIIHAANNSFPSWRAYNEMIGLGWRDRDYGEAVNVEDESGKLLRTPAGSGIGAGHGLRHSYLVKLRQPDHPILKGIPEEWLHATDELYHAQRGPAQNMTVLASAFSDPSQGGTAGHEPLLWNIPFGKGRVVTNLMGHLWPGQDHLNALHCVGFQTLFARTVEWLGSDQVTLPVPELFPSTAGAVLVDPVPLPANELPPLHRLHYLQRMGRESSVQDFAFSDPAAWRYRKSGQEQAALELFQQSQYEPPHRSPVNIALVDGQRFNSFVVDMQVQQTGREYGHRDLCLFFGFQDPSHFYYAHISTQTDDHAHNIFRVNGAPRIKISTSTTSGHDWGEKEWHRVRIQRDVENGSIEVFINDMAQPIMTANDKTFGRGWIGWGSFDDTGMASDIRIWAPDSEAKDIDFFGASNSH